MPTTASPTVTSTTAVFTRVRNHLGGPQILLGVVAPFVVYQVATGLRRFGAGGARVGRGLPARRDRARNSHGAAAST